MTRTLLSVAILSYLALLQPAHAQDAQTLELPPTAGKELRILRITPDGENVAAARQIVIEFNRAVVPVGDMARTAEDVGVSIEPAVNCQWRWLNTSALSCNLDEKDSLKPATLYTLNIGQKIMAEDGATLAASIAHSFTTERPTVQSAYTRTWDSPAKPVYRVTFNQPVTQDSVQKSLFFFDPVQKTNTAASVTPVPDDENIVSENGVEARFIWSVSPQSDLAANTMIDLKQGPGLKSIVGEMPSIEERVVRSFATFPAFAFRGVVCRDKENNEILVKPDVPQTQETLCNPMQPVSLSFTAPVLRSMIKDNFDFLPALNGGKKDYNPWGDEDRDYSMLFQERRDQEQEYRIGLPVGLKAAQSYEISVMAEKITLWQKIKSFFTGEVIAPRTAMKDEFGRSLQPFSMSFATGHRNPNFELIYNDAVLEKGVDSDVPLYVNNLKEFSFDYKRLTKDAVTTGTTGSVAVPAVQDVQFAMPAGVRDMLGGESGALYARLSTDPIATNKWDGARRLFAQVTPYQIYAKLGHFASSVWVTDLASGDVVADATVRIYKGALNNLGQPSDILATIKTDQNGLALLPGLATLDPDLSLLRTYNDGDTRLFIRVDAQNDMALLPISSDYEITLWDVATDLYGYSRSEFGHMKAWGMTAQGIYRAGDTMQYKIYVRNQDNNGFIAPPDAAYSLEISDAAGKKVEEIKSVKLNQFGSFAGEYKIPESASVGWYSFKLVANIKGQQNEFYPLSVLVSDFTPAPFKVSTEINGDLFKAGDRLDIDTNAALHSGGAYADAAVRTTITLKSRNFTSQNPAAKGYSFDSYLDETDSEDIFQKEDKLNDKGEWQTGFDLPEKPIVYGRLMVESTVRDDRGKSIAGFAQADYIGVDRLVGLQPTQWVYESGKPAIVKAIAVDDKGAPVSGAKIHVEIQKEEIVTAKVKSAGNAYTGDDTEEWVAASECAITSAVEGQDCSFTPKTAGSYRAVATITDTKGREHSTTSYLWVSGGDYVQWNEGRAYALPILPEKNDYKVGETARYLIKNPFPGAKALVSVERYGVMDSFVQTLEGSAPVIEIPVKPDYAPGYYLSVVVFSPRVDAAPPELGQIDMGKPAFRAGYVQTGIIDPYKTMTVTAKAEQDVYRPRDLVKVALNAVPLNAPDKKEPVELAVAVLDEAVFDLITDGKKAFDPYQGFYNLENLDVANYSLLTRLMGRQKFEKKGANPGGDGGSDLAMRNLFKFVSYWNPSVPVDANGNAKIEFEAPDNLTGWRILALATTPTDRMGLGDANFKVNRPTEIRPVMPNQVREGDEFSAGFSIMNRTDKERTITVTINATGDLKDKEYQTHEEKITLAPYKRQTVLVPLQTAFLPVSRSIAEGKIAFQVTASDDVDTDGMEYSLPLLKSRTIETAATYGTSSENTVSENFSIPKDIYSDSAEIGVTLSPSVLANLDGTFKYMRDYPYSCWEQKLTTAVSAAQYQDLKPYLSDETQWPEAPELPQKTIDMAASYQAPNGGMTYYNGKDDYVDPYLSAYTALGFSWLKKSGYKIPVNVEAALEKYLMGFLRNDKAPSYYNQAMVNDVRAVILAAYKDKIGKSDVLRFAPKTKDMNLFGKAHYMMAASNVAEGKGAAKDTLNMILSSGVESGGKFSFNQTYGEGAERILATPVRDNCAVLSAMLSYTDKEMIGDKPFKMVRMITQSRGSRDHFENTQENMFCMNALIEYAREYESEKPDMTITASYQDKEIGTATFKDVRDESRTIEKPLSEEDLGTKGTMTLTREGTGRYYYAARLRYAGTGNKDAVNAGIDIKRQYSVFKNGAWEKVDGALALERGDLVKVDLYVSVPTARNFVAVHDPLPGALETVNRDLATASTVDAASDSTENYIGFGGRWSFYHQELRHDSARFYADRLEPGNYHLSYTAQAIATGTFAAPPSKAEEMYDPDIYGLAIKNDVVVKEKP